MGGVTLSLPNSSRTESTHKASCLRLLGEFPFWLESNGGLGTSRDD